MVTLGAEGEVETVDEEHGTSYMELKPSTTLLVPMELMEGHEGLVGCPQLGPPELHQAAAQDEPTSETPSDFSLMLDVDDEVKDAEMPPLNDDLEFSVPPTLSPAVDDDNDEHVAKLEVILLEKEAQDAPVSGGTFEQEQGEETASMVTADLEGSLADEVTVQILNTDANHEPEDAPTLLDAELTVEDEEPAGLLMPDASPQQELPEDVAESVAVEEEGRLDENPETEAHHKEPEKNGPVNIDSEVTAIREAEVVAVEKDDPKTSEEDIEEMKTDTETKKNIVGRPTKQKDVKEEEEAASDSQVVEEPVEETPAPQEEKPIPLKPTRTTTRAKSVTFISPLTEEKEEEEDGKLAEAQSNAVPVVLRRTPRKSKQNKEPAVTPRRSSRRARQGPPEEEPVEATNQDATVLATSTLSSPARRRVSQRTASSRSSQSGTQESSATEHGGSEEDVADMMASRRSSSRTLTPSERRTPQSSTPRRSSRRILGSAEVVVSVPLEIVKEENEQEEVFTSVKHTSKQTKAEAAEEQPVLLEVGAEEERKAQASSPGRTTRHSSRNSLTVYSQVRTQKDKTYLSFELSRKHFHSFGSFQLSILSCITSSEHQEDEKTHCS